MSIVHKAPNGGTTNLQTLASDRAARALKINDGLAEADEAAKHKHVPVQKQKDPQPGVAPANVTERAPATPQVAPAVTPQVAPAVTPQVTEASVEAAIVKHREEEAPRPNMDPIIKQRVASVGPGSTRSVPHAPFVPNQPKPARQSSVGAGQAKRPAPEAPAPPAVPSAPAKLGAVTADSIAQAIAASRPAVPAPRVMAVKKPRR